MTKNDDVLLEMKNTSELMLDLAYSSLLYDNKEIAKEVIELEDRVDKLHESIKRSSLIKKKEFDHIEFDRSLILINISDSIERIADAALDIADVVLRDIDPHPVVRKSLEDSDVVIQKHVVEKGSVLSGKTLGDAKLATETGMWVIAIKRQTSWTYGPTENTMVKSGDTIFVRGPKDSEPILDKWIRGKK